jgi:ribose 5-phosphate isomerase B
LNKFIDNEDDMMKIAIASEHAGYELKEKLLEYIRIKGIEIEDVGAQSDKAIDYPFIAADLAEKVADGNYDRGILICGTGIGMSLAAGKVPEIRAALCTDPFMAKMAREHNDANVLCLGAWITGLKLSYAIVDAYLEAEFTAGRHARRIAQIHKIEQKYSRNSV